jgi:dihydroceramide fatty acyl 2-hydroxylase
VSQQRTARLAASPPLFENRLLDFFSRVHPSIPAIVFGPVVVGGVWLGLDRGLGIGETILLFLAGLLIWTLTEYWLHRLFFHWEPRFRGGDRLHFIIHGVHHDHPNDAMRLVMPPAVSIPLAALFLGAFVLVFGTPHAFPLFAAFIAGYLTYDYTHYHLHHHTPRTNLGKRLREQHMRHHFQDHRFGFGVSSPLWDAIFRTLPRRRQAPAEVTDRSAPGPGTSATE